MTPAARIAAAIGILDQVLDGQAAEPALLRWSRSARYAGSGDRAAVRDLVFDSLRKMRSRAGLGGAMTGRGLMIGMLREQGQDVAQVFTGNQHDPAALAEAEARSDARVDRVADVDVPDLPDWIMPLWHESLGENAGPIAQALRERAPVWLRVNRRKGDPAQVQAALMREEIATEASDLLPDALRVTANERRVSGSRAYASGLVEFQDLSPQLACAALPLTAGDRVLDYCAGGGGKGLALAGRQDVSVTAFDANAARMRDVPTRAARAGVRIEITDRPRGQYDLVIADVPCSGSGTWRRNPDQKWRLTPDKLAELTQLQAHIADQAADHVRPGGHLGYMTCSLLAAENDDRTADFLERHPDFRLTDTRRYTPLEAGDGFYLAVLERTP